MRPCVWNRAVASGLVEYIKWTICIGIAGVIVSVHQIVAQVWHSPIVVSGIQIRNHAGVVWQGHHCNIDEDPFGSIKVVVVYLGLPQGVDASGLAIKEVVILNLRGRIIEDILKNITPIKLKGVVGHASIHVAKTTCIQIVAMKIVVVYEKVSPARYG